MLEIRYLRTGRRNQPFFKIVVTEKRNSPVAGRFTEEVGFFNPLTKEKNLKAKRIKYWISVGAQLSDTVRNLLISEKIIEGKKVDLHKESKKEKEPKPEEQTPEKEAPKEEALKEKPLEEKPEEIKPEEKKEE